MAMLEKKQNAVRRLFEPHVFRGKWII